MSLSDSILMPHPPEVLAAIVKKKLDYAEVAFPGLYEKAVEWVHSDDFKRMFVEVPELSPSGMKRFKMENYAPALLIKTVKLLHGLPFYWYDTHGTLDWLCIYVWKSEGMSEKWYKSYAYNTELQNLIAKHPRT